MSISWSYISEICQQCSINNTDLPIEFNINVRTEQMEQKYKKWKQTVGETNLFNMVFLNASDQKFILRPNDFPYDFEENIIHYILWFHPKQNKYKYRPRLTKDLEELVYQKLRIVHPNVVSIIHYRNPPSNRSIQSIKHYHILLKIK